MVSQSNGIRASMDIACHAILKDRGHQLHSAEEEEGYTVADPNVGRFSFYISFCNIILDSYPEPYPSCSKHLHHIRIIVALPTRNSCLQC